MIVIDSRGRTVASASAKPLALFRALLLCLLALSMLSIASGAYNPFIYYRF